MPLSRTIGRALSAKLTRVTLDRFIQAHATPARTLDIGAQNGPYPAFFPNRVALDLRPGRGVQILGDAQALGLADGTFDVVLCTEVLEHLPEPQRAVDEMFRVLKPGGTLLLTTRFLFPIHDAPHDYFRFTKYGCVISCGGSTSSNCARRPTASGRWQSCCSGSGCRPTPSAERVFRAGWLIAARIVRPLAFLIAREYGDSRRLTPETGIMTSGYHVAARKPPR